MNRFFINSSDISGKIFSSEEVELCHQAFRVLKLRPGEKIIVCDNSEQEYIVELVSVHKDRLEGKVMHQEKKQDISTAHPVHLFVTPLKNQARFEWMLEKCTEIGAASFTPLITQRTEVKSLRKLDRLERIIKEAAEQSGRTKLPKLHPAKTFSDLLENPGKNFILTLHGEATEKLKRTGSEPMSVFIGPVGDFSEQEVSSAIENGFVPTTLGSQVLRTETAAVVASCLAIMKS